MDFNGQYLTYEEYKALGGTLDLTPFNLLEFEARRKIDIRTQNRLKNASYEEIPQEVKICDFQLINKMSNYDGTLSEVASQGIVASESTDGYSVNYVNSSQMGDILKSKISELEQIIRDNLLEVVFNNEFLIYDGADL